jgi:hypothetical protein
VVERTTDSPARSPTDRSCEGLALAQPLHAILEHLPNQVDLIGGSQQPQAAVAEQDADPESIADQARVAVQRAQQRARLVDGVELDLDVEPGVFHVTRVRE